MPESGRARSWVARLAPQVTAERRAIQARLAARDRASPLREQELTGGDKPRNADLIDEAHESLARELEFASRGVLVARLRALARAEIRIRQGAYGRCEACGGAIPAARLRALPEAVRCVPCAEEETQRAARSPHGRPAAFRGLPAGRPRQGTPRGRPRRREG